MKVAGLYLGRPSAEEVAKVLNAARRSAPTYDHTGSTLESEPRGGPAMRRRHLDVGSGRLDFEAARAALRSWVPQRGVGGRIEPEGQPVVVGATVVVVLATPLATVLAPNRIVAVVDEAETFAFAYGTLPGHPASGEERFTAELRDDQSVRVTIGVQAVPASRLARAGAPVMKGLQILAIHRYLRAVAGYVQADRHRREREIGG